MYMMKILIGFIVGCLVECVVNIVVGQNTKWEGEKSTGKKYILI